jgi:uncharacterized protein (DUF433 family)
MELAGGGELSWEEFADQLRREDDEGAWRELIVHDPAVVFGKARIRGTRLAADFLVDQLGGGHSIEEILEGYPGLTRDDVLACVQYGAYCIRLENRRRQAEGS